MKRLLISTFILAAYSAVLIKVMVFKDLPTIRIGQLMLNFSGTESGRPSNFMPFKTIVPYLLGDKGWIIAGINLVGNIAPLMPIGVLLPLIYRNVTWKKSLVLAVISGLTLEIMQTILNVGIFDIDDVILNALGVMIGYWAFIILAKWLRERRYINMLIATIIVLITLTGVFYAIYPHNQPLVNPEVRNNYDQSNHFGNEESEIPQNGDLCNGTGGTGQIISLGNHTLTIKSKQAVIQTINLTNKTIIKTSAGSISESDLKINEQVTLVIDESKTASTVLICN